MNKKINSAVFVNLDNTLTITNSGRTFPVHSADWKLVPEVLNALAYYASLGYEIVVVSNQEGISFGYFTEKVFIQKLENICDKIEHLLKLPKASIKYIYSTKIESYNTIPNPGMAYEIALEHEVRLDASVMLGTTSSHAEFANRAGILEYRDLEYVKNNKWTILQ